MTSNSYGEMAAEEPREGCRAGGAERKRRENGSESLIRGWLAVKRRVVKQERQCRNPCQARREAVLRYLEKKCRRELKNLFREPRGRKEFGECLMELEASGNGLIGGECRRSVAGWGGKDKGVGAGLGEGAG